MVQEGRAKVPSQPAARFAPAVLAVLIIALSATSRADDTAPAVVPPQAATVVSVPRAPVAPESASPDASAPGANLNPDTSDADLPKARVRRPPTPHMAAHGIDESVRRMSRGLGLDVGQQMQLREILLDQQRQIRKLRSEPPRAGVDWAAVTMGLADQTKARVRAMLTAEQKEKYTTDVPHETTAPAHADLQHWMQIQESNRQNDGMDSK
jgi:hypothetical protein